VTPGSRLRSRSSMMVLSRESRPTVALGSRTQSVLQDGPHRIYRKPRLRLQACKSLLNLRGRLRGSTSHRLSAFWGLQWFSLPSSKRRRARLRSVRLDKRHWHRISAEQAEPR
jgi:hypothetical protein